MHDIEMLLVAVITIAVTALVLILPLTAVILLAKLRPAGTRNPPSGCRRS